MSFIMPKEQQLNAAIPIRKALSLSTIFNKERATRSRPLSDAMNDDKHPYYTIAVKKLRRISLRRSPTSTSLISSSSSSSSSSSQSGSPQSTYSARSRASSSRITRITSRCLFPEGLKQDEITTPQRPACPAPFLNLSLEGLSLQNGDEWHTAPRSQITRLHADTLGRLSILCPSEESFYCRGLYSFPEHKEILRNRNRRPMMTSILAPSALKLHPKVSILTIDNSETYSSSNSSIYSFETTPEGAAF